MFTFLGFSYGIPQADIDAATAPMHKKKEPSLLAQANNLDCGTLTVLPPSTQADVTTDQSYASDRLSPRSISHKTARAVVTRWLCLQDNSCFSDMIGGGATKTQLRQLVH